jgi:hypothetical protein
VNLENLLLVDAKAVRYLAAMKPGTLEPDLRQSHRVASLGKGEILVESKFEFVVVRGGQKLLSASHTYMLVYSMPKGERVNESDVTMFARANGAYHAWPFVREQLFGLTAKMGLPPFVLPVLSFHGPRKSKERSRVGRKRRGA